MRKLLFLTAIAGAVAAYLKKQRERELDEAIWEEPRDLTAVSAETSAAPASDVPTTPSADPAADTSPETPTDT